MWSISPSHSGREQVDAAISANPLAADLEHILDRTGPVWEELRGERVFVTGGTGFFGSWLLESLLWANHRLGSNVRATILTREPSAFARNAPNIVANEAITLQQGDVRSFDFPEGSFSHVLHAATSASARRNADDPAVMLETIVDGTARTLEFASAHGASKFLLTSSGAVYGTQPPGITHVPEDFTGGPDPTSPASAYGEGKRMAELLCALHGSANGIQTKIARGFAFVGPYLPLDAHFAIGNFLRDALRGWSIVVKGDGTPHRSYLYAADLAVWLWTVLVKGIPGRPYNVGSEDDHTIVDVAHIVADVSGVTSVTNPVRRSGPSLRALHRTCAVGAWTARRNRTSRGGPAHAELSPILRRPPLVTAECRLEP